MCIAIHLNELLKTGISYIYPGYFWLLVVVIILLSQCSIRITNLTVGSSVQVLVTLIYISYSDLLSISLLVITPEYVHFNSSNSIVKLLVWFIYGNVLYGHNCYHIVLLCVSIVVLYFYSSYLLYWLDYLEFKCR